jgi:hypothetical protein
VLLKPMVKDIVTKDLWKKCTVARALVHLATDPCVAIRLSDLTAVDIRLARALAFDTAG